MSIRLYLNGAFASIERDYSALLAWRNGKVYTNQYHQKFVFLARGFEIREHIK